MSPRSADDAAPTDDGDGAPALSPVPEGQEDEAFRAVLAQRGVTLGSSVEERRDYALTICAQLDSDQPLDGLVDDVRIGTGLSSDLTGYVIGAATACFCPHNLSKLPSARPDAE